MTDSNAMARSNGSSPKKRGRPRWEPPDLKKVEMLAARGLTQAQIAGALGISVDTLQARKQDFSGFSEAIKKGQAHGLWDITNSLYQQAYAGNVTAIIFFLKNRDPQNWNDRRDFGQGPSERCSNVDDGADHHSNENGEAGTASLRHGSNGNGASGN